MFRQEAYAETLERIERGEPLRPADQDTIHELREYIAGREYLSTGDAARYLGVSSINTIKRWIDKGLFPNARQRNGDWEILLEDAAKLRETFEQRERANTEQDFIPPFNPRRPQRIRAYAR